MEEICLFVCEGEYCRESVTLPYNMKALVTLRSVAWKRVNEWNAPTSNPCKHPHGCDARLWLLAIIRLCAGKRSITLPKVKLKRETVSPSVFKSWRLNAHMQFSALSPHCFSFFPASTVGQEPLKKLEVTNTERSTTQHLSRQTKFCRYSLLPCEEVRESGRQPSGQFMLTLLLLLLDCAVAVLHVHDE